MKKFNITVNGKSYMVEVEELREEGALSTRTVSKPQPVAKKPEVSVKQEAPAPSAPPAPQNISGGVKAPMPGTINEIRVVQGQEVKAGEVLLILEAMKMENEILSPKEGKVVSIHTSKGSSVNTGDVLAVVE